MFKTFSFCELKNLLNISHHQAVHVILQYYSLRRRVLVTSCHSFFFGAIIVVALQCSNIGYMMMMLMCDGVPHYIMITVVDELLMANEIRSTGAFCEYLVSKILMM